VKHDAANMIEDAIVS